MQIASDLIRELRGKSGAGILDCKKALEETQGDIGKAMTILRERGKAKAEKKASRSATEGLIFAYIHPPGKLGVLLEMNCETDFVARNAEFQNLCKDVAMHITAFAPQYISRKDVPEDVVKKEGKIYATQARNKGKPEKIIEKIVDGRIEKFYKTVCCLEQSFAKNEEVTIGELIQQMIAKIGENIVLKRFVRFKVGEE